MGRQLGRGASIAVGSWLFAGLCLAQPTVHVLGESRLEVRVAQQGRRVLFDGSLRDDAHRPLPGRPVRLEIEGGGRVVLRAEIVTDGGGRFLSPMELPEGSDRLRAMYAGDADHVPITIERDLDPRLHDVQLRLRGGTEGRLRAIDLEGPPVTIELSATGPDGGRDLSVALVDERGVRLATARTDDRGEVTMEVAPDRLGAPGFGTWTFRSEGDGQRRPSELRAGIVRFSRTQLELTASTFRVRGQAVAELSGRLRAGRFGLRQRAVGIYRDGAHLTTVLTAHDGTFRYRHALSDDAKTGRIVARFDGEPPTLTASVSPERTVEVPSRELPSWLFALLPVLVSAGILIVLRRRKARVADSAIGLPVPLPPGLRRSAGSPRPSSRRELRGRILDHGDDRPIPNAHVSTTNASAKMRELVTDDAGRFAFEDLDPGLHRVRVEVDGYLPFESTAEIPHRGDLSTVEIRLESVRARALAAFRGLALPEDHDPRAWLVRTNRELVAALPVRDPTRAQVDSFAEKIESVYYGRSALDAEGLRAIAADADRLRAKLGPDRASSSEREPTSERD